MSVTGEEHGHAVRVGASIGDITAALFAVCGILAAVHKRHRTGLGSHVDIAMLDCQVAILENAIARYTTTGQNPRPLGTRHPTITPFATFKTADSAIAIAAGNDKLFARLTATLGLPQLAQDKRFATNEARTENHHLLQQQLEQALACLLYTSPSPRDRTRSRMPSSA